MNACFLFVGAVAETADATSLDTRTVVLGLLVVAIVWLARSLVSLRHEVESLREGAQPPAQPAVPRPVVSSGPTPAEVAAIAAAVHSVLGSSARLVAVGPAGSAELQAWSREGRRQVFQSHQIR